MGWEDVGRMEERRKGGKSQRAILVPGFPGTVAFLLPHLLQYDPYCSSHGSRMAGGKNTKGKVLRDRLKLQ